MPTSSLQLYLSRAIPFLAAKVASARGIGFLPPQPRWAGPASRISSAWLSHTPLVCPIVVGVAVSLSLWLLKRSASRQDDLKAANRALEHLNEQLKQEAQNANQSEQRFRLLFASNPCPMLI